MVSQWRTASNYQTAAAILSAIGAMRAGDVLLLEAQTTYSTVSGYLPVEVEEAVYDAIRAATDAGIIVIEPGVDHVQPALVAAMFVRHNVVGVVRTHP